MALLKRVVLVEFLRSAGSRGREAPQPDAALDYSSFILKGMVYSQSTALPWNMTGV
jgi:hypothetical protein